MPLPVGIPKTDPSGEPGRSAVVSVTRASCVPEDASVIAATVRRLSVQ